MKKLINSATIALFLVVAVAAGAASGLEKPTERPILTITGKIGETNAPNAAQFDRAMLEGLGMQTIETTTPWFNGLVKFEGVSMAKLLKTVGANGNSVKVVALNDYITEIPIEDFTKYGVVLALKRNGEYMPVRDKGPLFVVYPYDSDPELKTQKFYSRSAWQVTRIEVR